MPVSSNTEWDAIVGWMRHSLRLSEAVLEKPRHKTPEQLQATREEIALKKHVIEHVDDPGLRGVEAIWRLWMIAHAELQIARYAGTISEGEFRRQANEMLDRRDELVEERIADATN